MSSIRNLTDNVNESFQFQMRDKIFEMKYPNTADLEKIQDLTAQLKTADNDIELTNSINQEMLDSMYSFVKPVGHETPIKEALKNENFKVLMNFNKMIEEEFKA